jgi:hypothetical protein
VRREANHIADALVTMARSLRRLANAFERTDPAGRPARTLTLSPKRRATLKLQGRYMGALRSLGPRQKAQVKARKAAKGFPAAIALARQLRRGRAKAA